MSKLKIINPSADEIGMMIQRDLIPATGAYETAKSTTSRIYDPSAYVLEYRPY